MSSKFTTGSIKIGDTYVKIAPGYPKLSGDFSQGYRGTYQFIIESSDLIGFCNYVLFQQKVLLGNEEANPLVMPGWENAGTIRTLVAQSINAEPQVKDLPGDPFSIERADSAYRATELGDAEYGRTYSPSYAVTVEFAPDNTTPGNDDGGNDGTSDVETFSDIQIGGGARAVTISSEGSAVLKSATAFSDGTLAIDPSTEVVTYTVGGASRLATPDDLKNIDKAKDAENKDPLTPQVFVIPTMEYTITFKQPMIFPRWDIIRDGLGRVNGTDITNINKWGGTPLYNAEAGTVLFTGFGTTRTVKYDADGNGAAAWSMQMRLSQSRYKVGTEVYGWNHAYNRHRQGWCYLFRYDSTGLRPLYLHCDIDDIVSNTEYASAYGTV